MRYMGHLRHGMVIGLALLAGCGGLEGTEAGAEHPEATGTVEVALYESPDSLAGLVGTYSRSWPLAASEELLTMTLTGTEYVDRVEGSYVRTVSRTCPVVGCNTETGSFYALPNNPAIGSFIAFRNLAGETVDVYSISQIQRSLFTGKITGIILQKGVNGSQPFTMIRVGF